MLGCTNCSEHCRNSVGLSYKGEAYPLKLPLNLSTGKVSHWKAKENSTTKPTKKIIAGPTENKACN